MRVPACGRGPVGVCLDRNSAHTHANRGQAHRDDEASLLEVLDEGNGVLLEVGEAAVDGLGVVVRSSLLLGSLVQPLLQAVVGAGQEHHQVRGADLPGAQREGMKRDGRPPCCCSFICDVHSEIQTPQWEPSLRAAQQDVRTSSGCRDFNQMKDSISENSLKDSCFCTGELAHFFNVLEVIIDLLNTNWLQSFCAFPLPRLDENKTASAKLVW